MRKLVIKDLCKSYGDKKALIDFSCDFEPGVYGILGANGAGKSTLMNIISRNLRADSGCVSLEPEGSIAEVLGFMPQQQVFYPEFSARSFLYYMASLKGIKKPKAEIEYLLDVVNLKDVAHRKMKTYSGGMRQRVLLAQALLGNPQILLLDEPTAGLDPAERIRIRNFISQFSKDKVVILATHVVSDIEFIASQVIIMRQGEIVGVKSPGEWMDSIDGKVGECVVQEEEIEEYQERFKIGNIFRRSDGIVLRIVGDVLPPHAVAVRPMLEDVYLFYEV